MCADQLDLPIRAASVQGRLEPAGVVHLDVVPRPGSIEVDVPSWRVAPLPAPELFLRELLVLDIGKVGPVARFLNDFGFLYAAADSPLVNWSAAAHNALVPDPRIGSPDWSAYALMCLRHNRDARLQTRGPNPPDEVQIVPRAFETDGARLLLMQVRDMTRIWLMGWGWVGLKDVQREWESSHWIEGGPATKAECASFLAATLSAGLAPFHPRVLLENDEAPIVDLYAALCAQLYDAILANRRPRRCKRQSCQSYFVNQRGRAKYGQHRDSEYCDKRCAQRDADDRRRANVDTARRLKREGHSDSRIAREMHANIGTVRRWLDAAAKRSRGDAL